MPLDLPRPEDDGAANHLRGMTIPPFSLSSTAGNSVDLSTLSGLTVVFCYPRTGAPGETITDDWNSIPGARGCTPQACSFRDASAEFLSLGVTHTFGASTQDTPYQQEVKERTNLPFQLLSDGQLGMAKALNLPTFEWKGTTLIKRLSMVIEDGKIVKVVSASSYGKGSTESALNDSSSIQYFPLTRAQMKSCHGSRHILVEQLLPLERKMR